MRQPGRVDEAGVREPELLRLVVHPLRERILAAGNEFGQRDRGVVAGLHDHPAQQFVDGDRAPRLDEHPRALGAPCALGHRHRLRRRDRPGLQRGEGEVRGHQLGERRGVAALVGVLRDDRLAARPVDEDVRRRGDRRGRGGAGHRGDGRHGRTRGRCRRAAGDRSDRRDGRGRRDLRGRRARGDLGNGSGSGRGKDGGDRRGGRGGKDATERHGGPAGKGADYTARQERPRRATPRPRGDASSSP